MPPDNNQFYKLTSGRSGKWKAPIPSPPPQNRNDVFSVKTGDQFDTVYFKSATSTEKIAVLNALPMVIQKFKDSTQTAPAWLSTILSDALNNTDLTVAQCAVEQIGVCGLVSYSSTLISMI